MISSLDAPPRSPLNTDSWDGYGAERAELIDFIGDQGIEDVAFVTGDIHTFFTSEVTRTGRRATRGDVPDPVNGPVRAVEFVGGAVTSPGIIDRVAVSEPERVAAATPVDAGALGNNPHMAFSNQAYKGYAIVDASRGTLNVRYRAVRDTRQPHSEVFTLRRFTVESGRAAIASQDGPLPLPAPSAPGPAGAGSGAGAGVAGEPAAVAGGVGLRPRSRGARSPRGSTTTPSSPSQPAISSSSARSASAVSAGAPGSACAAWTSSAPAWRSALRSTRATSRSPSRNGST